MKSIRSFVNGLAVTAALGAVLVGIAWVSGYDLSFDDGLSVTWSDLGDHPTNWLQQVQP